jgi:heme A synthase
MVNWDKVKRMALPLSEEQWHREYEEYVNNPEWKYKSSAHVATERNLVGL